MSKIVLRKVKDNSKFSLWRMEIHTEAGGNTRFVHVYLLELPKRKRSVELLASALSELGHKVEVEVENHD
ncbi:MAG: hypothetical protein QW706_09655 [Candidatus Nezhaarchaeales archaeon]